MAFCARKGVTCIDVSSWLRLAPEHIGRGSTDERADEYPACEQPMVRKAFRPRNAALAAAQRRQRDRPYSGRGRHAGARQHARTAARLSRLHAPHGRSEEHTSELQSLMRISYAVFCLKKKKTHIEPTN